MRRRFPLPRPLPLPKTAKAVAPEVAETLEKDAPAGKDDEGIEDLSIHPRPVTRLTFAFGLFDDKFPTVYSEIRSNFPSKLGVTKHFKPEYDLQLKLDTFLDNLIEGKGLLTYIDSGGNENCIV